MGRKNFYGSRTINGADVTATAVEIKSGKTINKDFFMNLNLYTKYAGSKLGKAYLIYGGDENQIRKETAVLSWKQAREIFNEV